MKKQIVICFMLCFVILLTGCSIIKVGDGIPEEVHQQAHKLGVDYIGYDGYIIHNCGLGIVEVLKWGNGGIQSRVGFFPIRVKTHLTMLSLHKGMTVPEVVAACGMPEGAVGSGVYRLYYKTANGYTYTIVFRNKIAGKYDPYATEVYGYNIISPEGERWTDEEAVIFQWTVRLVYLGIAAVLGVVLVLLIKIPNNIRKRKEISEAK